MKRVAAENGWPETLVFNGAHCVRHGGAMSVHREALEQVRLRGGWASPASARHYSTSGQVQPRETTASRDRRAQIESEAAHQGRRLLTAGKRAARGRGSTTGRR